MQKTASSVALFLSVLVCTAAILAAQYFVFMPMLQKATGTDQLTTPVKTVTALQDYLPADKTLEPCSTYADGRSLSLDTTCVIAPTETIQTYSAIKIWSYAEQDWINPPNYTQAGERTLISAAEYQPGLPGPIILSCPWGCTIGYP